MRARIRQKKGTISDELFDVIEVEVPGCKFGGHKSFTLMTPEFQYRGDEFNSDSIQSILRKIVDRINEEK